MNRTEMILTVILAFTLLAITCGRPVNGGMDSPTVGLLSPADLRCEYLVNPLGADVVKPPLSWPLESSERGQKPAAYHALVASSRETLDGNAGDLWDSGQERSDQSLYGKIVSDWKEYDDNFK